MQYAVTTRTATNSNTQILTQKLHFGVHGTQVSILENFLSDMGYFVTPEGDMRKYINSFFGTVTHSAVKRFQADRGLVADGIVGPNTRAVINAHMQMRMNTR